MHKEGDFALDQNQRHPDFGEVQSFSPNFRMDAVHLRHLISKIYATGNSVVLSDKKASQAFFPLLCLIQYVRIGRFALLPLASCEGSLTPTKVVDDGRILCQEERHECLAPAT